MTQAQLGDTVRVHYTGKLEDGKVVETTANKDPIQFKIGDERILLGFERAVIGMSPGELKTTKILADQAHGPYQKEFVMEINRSQLPSNVEPKVGKKLDIQLSDDIKLKTRITNVSGSKVTLDANHPLAGKDLYFKIKLLEIV